MFTKQPSNGPPSFSASLGGLVKAIAFIWDLLCLQLANKTQGEIDCQECVKSSAKIRQCNTLHKGNFPPSVSPKSAICYQ